MAKIPPYGQVGGYMLAQGHVGLCTLSSRHMNVALMLRWVRRITREDGVRGYNLLKQSRKRVSPALYYKATNRYNQE